jgi:hypothetical protein
MVCSMTRGPAKPISAKFVIRLPSPPESFHRTSHVPASPVSRAVSNRRMRKPPMPYHVILASSGRYSMRFLRHFWTPLRLDRFSEGLFITRSCAVRPSCEHPALGRLESSPGLRRASVPREFKDGYVRMHKSQPKGRQLKGLDFAPLG